MNVGTCGEREADGRRVRAAQFAEITAVDQQLHESDSSLGIMRSHVGKTTNGCQQHGTLGCLPSLAMRLVKRLAS